MASKNNNGPVWRSQQISVKHDFLSLTERIYPKMVYEAFRQYGRPTFMEAVHIPWEGDILTSGLIFCFGILAISFYLIIPGVVGKEVCFFFTPKTCLFVDIKISVKYLIYQKICTCCECSILFVRFYWWWIYAQDKLILNFLKICNQSDDGSEGKDFWWCDFEFWCCGGSESWSIMIDGLAMMTINDLGSRYTIEKLMMDACN